VARESGHHVRVLRSRRLFTSPYCILLLGCKMSYSSVLGFGTIPEPELWKGYYAESDEVFVFNTHFYGTEFKTGNDLKKILDASGEIFKTDGSKLNIVGIIVQQVSGVPVGLFSIIATIKEDDYLSTAPPVTTMIAGLEEQLGVTLSGSFWYYYDDAKEKPNINYWFSEPLMWDSTLSEGGAITPAGTSHAGFYIADSKEKLLGYSNGLKHWDGTPRKSGLTIDPVKDPKANGGGSLDKNIRNVLIVGGCVLAVWVAAYNWPK